MPKRAGTAYVRQLRSAKNFARRLDLCLFGRIVGTEAGKLVGETIAWYVFDEHIHSYGKSGLSGSPEAVGANLQLIAKQMSPLFLNKYKGIDALYEFSNCLYSGLEEALAGEGISAIVNGRAEWFSDLAEAVALWRRNGQKPFDCYRLSLLNLLFASMSHEASAKLGQEGSAHLPLTQKQVCEHLRREFPELSDREDFPRQVRRWCSELGIKLAKDKPGRRHGSRNRWGQK